MVSYSETFKFSTLISEVPDKILFPCQDKSWVRGMWLLPGYWVEVRWPVLDMIYTPLCCCLCNYCMSLPFHLLSLSIFALFVVFLCSYFLPFIQHNWWRQLAGRPDCGSAGGFLLFKGRFPPTPLFPQKQNACYIIRFQSMTFKVLLLMMIKCPDMLLWIGTI